MKSTTWPWLIVGIIVVLIIILIVVNNKPAVITSFEECVAAGYPVMESYPRQCTANGQHFVEAISTNTTIPANIQAQVVESVRERAIVNNGGAIPIEGFDPGLYKGAYPGLVDADFENTAAISGRWDLQNGELEFIRDPSGAITSADGTLTDEGVITLIENVARRLALPVQTQNDIQNILDVISADNSQTNRTYCTPQDREGDVCIQIYQPVCGWNDPQRVQCIRYPCAQTYSNSCVACQNENVLYYTPGECPSG